MFKKKRLLFPFLTNSFIFILNQFTKVILYKIRPPKTFQRLTFIKRQLKCKRVTSIHDTALRLF